VVATNTEELLSLPEAAERLGVSIYTVRRWIKDGRLRAFKPGKEYRVREADLEEFLAAREVRPKGPAPSPLEPSLFYGLEEEWRSQLELLESCVQYKVGRAEFYERELERGRSSDYATARGAENLAILAREEFAGITRWVIDGPLRPLAIALEQVPSNVDPRIAEEFEAKVDVMIYRAKQTTDLLFEHAYHLAESTEQRNELAKKRRQGEKLEKRAARGEMRSA
jgi:excisionase family DNA binding protein